MNKTHGNKINVWFVNANLWIVSDSISVALKHIISSGKKTKTNKQKQAAKLKKRSGHIDATLDFRCYIGSYCLFIVVLNLQLKQ